MNPAIDIGYVTGAQVTETDLRAIAEGLFTLVAAAASAVAGRKGAIR